MENLVLQILLLIPKKYNYNRD